MYFWGELFRNFATIFKNIVSKWLQSYFFQSDSTLDSENLFVLYNAIQNFNLLLISGHTVTIS